MSIVRGLALGVGMLVVLSMGWPLGAAAICSAPPPGACEEDDGSLPEGICLEPLLPEDPDDWLAGVFDDPTVERAHVVLRFGKRISPSQHQALRAAGVRLVGFLGGNAYIASLPRSAEPGQGPLVELVVAREIPPRAKIDARLAGGRIPPWAVDRATGNWKLLVEMYGDFEGSCADSALSRLDPQVVQRGGRLCGVSIDRGSLRRLIGLDSVKRVEPGPLPFIPLNETVRAAISSDQAQGFTLSGPQPSYQLDGSPVAIGIFDGGIDESHPDFDQITASGTAGSSRVDPAAEKSDKHGTHVASIAGGSGLRSTAAGLEPFERRGHAPGVRLGDYPMEVVVDFSLTTQALLEDGMDLTNHSYPQSMTAYDGVAVEVDAEIAGEVAVNGLPLPAVPQVWAAGNNGVNAKEPQLGGDEAGYYSVHTSAKNSISVGSVDALDDDLSDFSSLGPTFDGRIKPDVMAPGVRDWFNGTGVEAAAVGNQGYTGQIGTSMAAPAVSGVLALLMHQIQKKEGELPVLLPSTYKAILVQTAEDLVKTIPWPESHEFENPDTESPVFYHRGPDFATGHGRIHAERARALVADDDRFVQSHLDVTCSQEHWCLKVPDGADEIRVTLAWDDLPGDTCLSETTPKLVNDLDLHLTGPDGAVVRPFTLEPLPPPVNPGVGAKDPIQPEDVKPAFRCRDALNNVEVASIAAPAAGTWKVTVTAYRLPFELPQAFSLAASGHLESCP